MVLSKGDNQLDKLSPGSIPLISSGFNNNGITGFINKGDKISQLFPKNVITVDMFGTPFFQTYNFYSVSHGRLNILLPRKKITYSGFFIVKMLEQQSDSFSYNNMANSSRLNRKRIMLPILSNGNPDWDYMEQYIINIINAIDVPKLEPIKTSNIDLNTVRWHDFKISDVMNILSGVRLTSSDMIHGNIPFIGASDSNNGITNWTSNTNSSTDSNVLGINYNGSVGEVFYHSYVATFSDDVKRLKLKQNTRANKEVYLFIKTMLLQQKSKYAYGYKFNGKRMKAQKIMLPVTVENIPDWQFMEDYVKSISNSRLL
ncbi:restriction endonuclease subunit S [Leuconostoc mesenteroides]|uniref:restriction endonuclease subunit S n=1 Tax=Leuconostoc mesenteroides TaxID=1245 RepID=UPI003B6358AA